MSYESIWKDEYANRHEYWTLHRQTVSGKLNFMDWHVYRKTDTSTQYATPAAPPFDLRQKNIILTDMEGIVFCDMTVELQTGIRLNDRKFATVYTELNFSSKDFILGGQIFNCDQTETLTTVFFCFFFNFWNASKHMYNIHIAIWGQESGEFRVFKTRWILALPATALYLIVNSYNALYQYSHRTLKTIYLQFIW